MVKGKGKVLFFYHHFGGLGHGTRIAAICKALSQADGCEIVVINSGAPQPELNIQKYAWVVNLPAFEAEHDLFAGLKANEGVVRTFQKRRLILEKVRAAFKPDVAVFEHFPFGRGALAKEISSFIGLLKNDGCTVYSSVRDIIDQPVDEEALSGYLKLFDGILVHSDERMGFVTSFRQSKELREKIFLTGRVMSQDKKDLKDPESFRKRFNVGKRKWVVISAGGGIDGEGLIDRSIRLKKLLDEKEESFFLISTGPNISDHKYKALKKRIRGCNDIVMTRFDAGLVQYVNAADLSISMGGYNSINNALLTGTRTLIFPRKTDEEQKKRVRYFNKYVEGIDEDVPDAEVIKCMRVHLQKPKVRSSIRMTGAQATARMILTACHMRSLKIRVTSQCDLACDMCSWKGKKEALPIDVIRALVAQARIIGVKIVNLTGGEPTLFPGVVDILRNIKERSLEVSLSTNGCGASSQLKRIIPFLDHVDISLDADRAVLHDRIRGRKGAFNRTLQTIGALAAQGIHPHINVTIRPDNYRGLHRIVSMLAGRMRSISFSLVDTSMNNSREFVFSDEQLKEFYFDEVVLILRECVNNKISVSISPFFKEFYGQDAGYILERMLLKKAMYRRRFREIFMPDHQECGVPRRQIRINSNGDISACCFQDDLKMPLGNVIKQSLCEIVVSDEYQDLVLHAVAGESRCRVCKKSFSDHYGDEQTHA
jgi:predicted glycosyltransferase/MoaA/NifB/PqqE/SkfB family radical SAM enzyme